MTVDELTKRVEYLETVTRTLHRRLFRAERRLLLTAAVLTHADEKMDHDKDHPFPKTLVAKTLVEGLPACSVKLTKLCEQEENECCAHFPGSG